MEGGEGGNGLDLVTLRRGSYWRKDAKRGEREIEAGMGRQAAGDEGNRITVYETGEEFREKRMKKKTERG